MRSIVITSIILFLFSLPYNAHANDDSDSAAAAKDFSGYSLVEAIPNTNENVELLRYLDANMNEDAMDFWSDPTTMDKPVEILIHPELDTPSKQLFQQRNISLNVISNNFTEMIEEEKLELAIEEENFIWSLRTTSAQYQGEYTLDLFSYNSLRKMNEYIAHLSQNTANYNSLVGLNVNLRSIGTTYEGRGINMLSISLNNGRKKPAVWLDCGVHSRERVSPAFCLYAIDRLVRQSENLLNMYDFYIVPVMNPDGYAYMESGNRMWRKNRKPNTSRKSTSSVRSERQFSWGQQFQGVMQGFPGASSPQQVGGGFPGSFPAGQQGPPQASKNWGTGNKCTGTDVNRNFDMDWATVGSSYDSCQDTYHGSAPFSEAESRATRDAINAIKSTQTVAAFVSVHSYSQLWMTPYGSKKSLSPHNTDLKRVAQIAVSALGSLYGTRYEFGPISHIIYKAAGSSVDWAHDRANIKYSYGLELRPGRQGGGGFMLPVSQIKPTVEETWAGIKAMCMEIKKEYVSEQNDFDQGNVIQSVP